MKMILSLVAATALLVGANVQAIDVAAVNQALASADRSDADKALDAARKPAEVLDFLGLEPGMTVLDVMSGGGWYTEVLSLATGANGKVYMQNSEAALARGTTQATVDARLARLSNVELLKADATADLMLPANSIDFAITNLNFHGMKDAAKPFQMRPNHAPTPAIQNSMLARASSKLTQLASKFPCEIWMSRAGRRVNAKSIMGVMMLAAAKGSTINIETSGEKEREAMDAIVALINEYFGEGE